MIELTLLAAFSIKENLDKYISLINTSTLCRESVELLKVYKVYFEQTKDTLIEWGKFKEYFFVVCNPNLDEKSNILYKEILDKLSRINRKDNIDIQNILNAYEQQELYRELNKLIDKNENIEIVKDLFNKHQKTNLNIEFEHMDIEGALEFSSRKNGLRWRCKALDDHFDNTGVIPGDFIVITGYTNVGKTGFLCSEVSYMAQQIKSDQKVLWFNTEGDWKRVLPRIYCSTLKCDSETLLKHKNRIKEEYLKKMKIEDRIQLINAQGFHIKKVEKYIKELKPALVVFDMIDAFRGFDKFSNSESSVERYNRLYQWALEMSQIAPVLATSQTNRNGNNTEFPSITEMRGSGVDKQAAANVIIAIGKKFGQENIRYLSTPKFKVNGDEEWTASVEFDVKKVLYI